MVCKAVNLFLVIIKIFAEIGITFDYRNTKPIEHALVTRLKQDKTEFPIALNLIKYLAKNEKKPEL